MARNYAEAAVRQYVDAEALAAANRFDVAAHLVGLSAECALKKAAGGFTQPPDAEIDGHIPGVLRTIRLILQGRNARGRLLGLVQRQSYFATWHINDRYEADGHVAQARYEQWRDDAKQALSIARLRY